LIHDDICANYPMMRTSFDFAIRFVVFCGKSIGLIMDEHYVDIVGSNLEIIEKYITN